MGLDFPGDGSTCQYRGRGKIPRLGRSPEVGNGNPLKFLPWKIPWIEEPGRVQSMGSQRVRHNLVT